MNVDSNWCTLKVNKDGMYALMCLHACEGDEGHGITVQYVYDFLTDQGIVHGVNEIAVTSMVEQAMFEQYVCVAQGKPATRGEDGHYEFTKDTHDIKKHPLIQEDGSVDYKNSLNLAVISEGELLAKYVPPTSGEDGIDVYGNEIKSPGDGKDIMALRGKGITSDPDTKDLYAAYSGHIVMDGSNVSIDKLYRVSGDLDIEHGNIRFEGDVEVSGDVRSGLSIEAKGNIFIHGHVGASILTSGGNITIEKGIQGRDACEITAGGDVICKFIERARITSGGSVYADSVLNSSIQANEKVIVTSRAGNVISSEVYGMTGVEVKEAGNTAGAATLLRAGLPRDYYVRANDLTKEIQEIDAKLASFVQHMNVINDPGSAMPEEKKNEMRTQIMRAKIVLTSQKKECTDELEELNKKIAGDSENSRVTIQGTIYAGVRIYLGMFPFLVTEPVREVTYTISNNDVIATALDDEE